MDAKTRRSLNKRLRQERADIASASKKRGLWATIGSSLGSLLAMAVTGGAAAPIVAGMVASGLSYVGGSLGNVLAKKSKGGKIKGGRFYQGERESLASDVQEGVEAGAVKTGFKTALGKLGGKISIGKGGITVSSGGKATVDAGSGGGFNFKDMFKSGAKGEYGEGLIGKLGKSLDFKESALVGAGDWVKSKALAAKTADLSRRGLITSSGEIISEGKVPGAWGSDVPDLESLLKDELSMDPTEGFLDQDVYRAQVYKNTPPSDPFKSVEAQEVSQTLMQKFKSKLNTPKLTKGQRAAYDKINKMSDAGYDVPPGGGLPEEFGKGFIDLDTGETRMQPKRPNVLMPSLDQGLDEGFELGPEADIKMPEWSGFDEGSWKEGERKLREIDLQRDLGLQERLGLPGESSLMDNLGKPSLDIPFEAPSRVGMDHPRLPYTPQAELERVRSMSETAQREAALNLRDTDFVQTPYQTEFEALDQNISWHNRFWPSQSDNNLRRSKAGTGFDPRY